ncbi:acyltransferase family protein [Rhodanobacter sp. FW102-FHT14D06]|uniref:Acyltransferase family protein n=2 Tax=unclassified Rhodanobacter TaxID=2621553 RepID=A0AB74ULJ0_9GAMM
MNDTALANEFPQSATQAPRALRTTQTMIYPLQYLRAIAAFCVVLCHASYYVLQARGDGRMWEIFARAGTLGVFLFFAISGYLMAHLAENASSMRFLAHRLIRIYPIYWLCVLGVVVVSFTFGHLIRPDPLALMLVPGATQSYILGVEWTLPFELTFYLIVFLVIVTGLRRALPAIAIAWVFLIELLLVARPDLQQGQFPLLLNLPLSQYSIPFAAGLLIPLAIKRRWIGPATPLIALAMLVTSEAASSVGMAVSSGLMGFGCVLLVASAVQSGISSTKPPNRPMLALGDWSYALYLCHVPVIRALCWIAPSSVMSMQLWFAALGAPIFVAILLGKADLAMYRWFKSHVDGCRPMVRTALGLVFIVSILSVSAYSYAQLIRAKRLNAATAPLAAKIDAAMDANETKLAFAARSVGLHDDPTLVGHFDGVYGQPTEVRVQGWAADSTISKRSVRVLVFHCGHYLGVVSPQDSRSDVTAALRNGSSHQGFNLNVPMPTKCASSRVDGLIMTDSGSFAIIEGQMR